jgi:hypothetical protein
MRLTSFSPTSSDPGVDLYRHAGLLRAVQNCLHPFDHRPFYPGLYVCRLLYVALDEHLVVADENWHGPRTLAPTLPQEGVCFFDMR